MEEEINSGETELFGESSRDLLKHFKAEVAGDENSLDDESREVELNLGLSLGGPFGGEKRLVRATSIAEFAILRREPEALSSVGSLLVRACSLPIQAEEEQRKRKQMQSLRRMEAKKKRIEKLRNSRGSLETSKEGLSSLMESKSSVKVCCLPDRDKQKEAIMPTRPTPSAERSDEPAKKDSKYDSSLVMGISRNMMDDMPCVSAKVDGPNGRKIEGFLYKYSKGEEVRIVCVCHGRFLSPAEFVKHAGGGDVAHPLRHIFMTPSPSSLL